MSKLGSIRLLNAIENGSYTAGTLNTAVGSSARLDNELEAIWNNRSMLHRLLQTSPTVILDSAYSNLYNKMLATDYEIRKNVILENKNALDIILASSTLFSNFIVTGGLISEVHSSKTAQEKLGNITSIVRDGTFVYAFGELSCSETITSVKNGASTTVGNTFIVANNKVFRRLNGGKTLSVCGLPSSFTANSVAASGNTVVAVGSPTSDAIYYSTDQGATWTEATGYSVQTFNKVIVVPTTGFIAVGTSGTINTSADGITWTNRTSGSTATLNDVYYDGTSVYACGASSNVCRSTTLGVSWNMSSHATALNLVSIASSNTTNLVAVAATAVSSMNSVYSTNSGVNLSTQAIIGSTTNLNSVIWTGDRYYVGSASTGAVNLAATSTNATTWSNISFGSNSGSTVAGAIGCVVLVPTSSSLGIAIRPGSVGNALNPSTIGNTTQFVGSSTGKPLVINGVIYIFNSDTGKIFASNLSI